MVIAMRSNCRVHGRTAAPGAVVLAGGLVLLREVGRLGRHGRLEPVDGDGFKSSLLYGLKTLLESGDFQGQSVDRTVDAQNRVVSLRSLRLEGKGSFPLFQSPGGNDEENQTDNDAEHDGVDDQMRVHLWLLGVVQRGGQGVADCPAVSLDLCIYTAGGGNPQYCEELLKQCSSVKNKAIGLIFFAGKESFEGSRPGL